MHDQHSENLENKIVLILFSDVEYLLHVAIPLQLEEYL